MGERLTHLFQISAKGFQNQGNLSACTFYVVNTATIPEQPAYSNNSPSYIA